MWSLYEQAKAWSARPADLFPIPEDCEYLRWCFDDAVLYFGRWVDAKYDLRHKSGANKGKRIYSMAQLLNDETPRPVQSVMALAALGTQGGIVIR